MPHVLKHLNNIIINVEVGNIISIVKQRRRLELKDTYSTVDPADAHDPSNLNQNWAGESHIIFAESRT